MSHPNKIYICDLGFRTRTQILKNVHAAVSKHLGILPKIRGGGNGEEAI